MTSKPSDVGHALANFRQIDQQYAEKRRAEVVVANEKEALAKQRREALDKLYEVLKIELGEEFSNFAYRFREDRQVESYWRRKLGEREDARTLTASYHPNGHSAA